MPLVTTTEMFKKAYAGGYAVGAFNVNDMEMIQAIVEAANELRSPVILQVSAGARKYANPVYLRHLVEAAVETTDIPIAMHLASPCTSTTAQTSRSARPPSTAASPPS